VIRSSAFDDLDLLMILIFGCPGTDQQQQQPQQPVLCFCPFFFDLQLPGSIGKFSCRREREPVPTAYTWACRGGAAGAMDGQHRSFFLCLFESFLEN
jgi:hypothetical protein